MTDTRKSSLGTMEPKLRRRSSMIIREDFHKFASEFDRIRPEMEEIICNLKIRTGTEKMKNEFLLKVNAVLVSAAAIATALALFSNVLSLSTAAPEVVIGIALPSGLITAVVAAFFPGKLSLLAPAVANAGALAGFLTVLSLSTAAPEVVIGSVLASGLITAVVAALFLGKPSLLAPAVGFIVGTTAVAIGVVGVVATTIGVIGSTIRGAATGAAIGVIGCLMRKAAVDPTLSVALLGIAAVLAAIGVSRDFVGGVATVAATATVFVVEEVADFVLHSIFTDRDTLHKVKTVVCGLCELVETLQDVEESNNYLSKKLNIEPIQLKYLVQIKSLPYSYVMFLSDYSAERFQKVIKLCENILVELEMFRTNISDLDLL